MPKVMRWVADQSAEHDFRIGPATYEKAEKAEKAAGFRLDRRRNYWISKVGEAEEKCVVTLGCSGCGCGPSSVCSECGHSGKHRFYFGYPAKSSEQRKELRNLYPPSAATRGMEQYLMANRSAAQIGPILPRFIRAGEAYGYQSRHQLLKVEDMAYPLFPLTLEIVAHSRYLCAPRKVRTPN